MKFEVKEDQRKEDQFQEKPVVFRKYNKIYSIKSYRS